MTGRPTARAPREQRAARQDGPEALPAAGAAQVEEEL